MKKKILGTITVILASAVIIVAGTGTLKKLMAETVDNSQGTEVIEAEKNSDKENSYNENGDDENLDNTQNEESDVEFDMNDKNIKKIKKMLEEQGEEKELSYILERAKVREDRSEKKTYIGVNNTVEKSLEWNGCEVKIYELDTQHEEGELEYTEAIEEAVKYIRKLTDRIDDLSNTYIEILLYTSNEKGSVYFGKKGYSISFYCANKFKTNGNLDFDAHVSMDVVTGEINAFHVYNDNWIVTQKECVENDIIIDGYTEREWGYADYKDLSDDEVETHLNDKMESVKAEYESIAKDFIKNYLNVGELTKSYSYTVWEDKNFRYSDEEEVGEYDMMFLCDTYDGDAVFITVDQLSKNVISCVVNLSEEELARYFSEK